MISATASSSDMHALLRPTNRARLRDTAYVVGNRLAALLLLCVFAPAMALIALLVAHRDGMWAACVLPVCRTRSRPTCSRTVASTALATP